jgi:magnesium and cobalt transporter
MSEIVKSKDPEPSSRKINAKKSIGGVVRQFFSNFKVSLLSFNNEPFYQILKQLTHSAKKMSVEEKNILTNFLQFGHKTVKNVMIPRSDISGVSIQLKLGAVYKDIVTHGHTRTVVYQDTLDNPQGFIHIKDLFAVAIHDKDVSLKKLVRQHLITTSSTRLIDLLVEMRKKRTHIALVVDEYGGIEGMVTIEDIVEEIVGDIEDEHDDDGGNKDYSIVDENVIVTSARVEIKELEHVLGIELLQEGEDVETIGGLVMLRVGSVPAIGTVINISENVTAEVLDSNSRVIQRLKIKLH